VCLGWGGQSAGCALQNALPSHDSTQKRFAGRLPKKQFFPESKAAHGGAPFGSKKDKTKRKPTPFNYFVVRSPLL
jgi:hypothetical protein